MRYVNTCYLILAIIMASAMISITCFQHYIPKVSITISCDDPADEDGSTEFEDDKEHTSHVISLINPPPDSDSRHYYLEIESIHATEINVPPPEV